VKELYKKYIREYTFPEIFCPGCGKQVGNTVKICPSCKKENAASANFCSGCGAKLQ